MYSLLNLVANWKPQQTVTPQIKHLEGTHTPTRSTRNAQNPIQEINQFCSHNPNAVKQPGQYSNQGSNMLHGLGNNQHKFTSFAGGINYTKNIIGSTRYDVRF